MTSLTEQGSSFYTSLLNEDQLIKRKNTEDLFQVRPKKKKYKLVPPAVFCILSLLIILGLFGFLAFFFTTGVKVFTKVFIANPNERAGSSPGCFQIDHSVYNPSNVAGLYPPCGYKNRTTTLFPSLNVPRASWSYVNFTSRESTDSRAPEKQMNLSGIILRNDVNRDPFVIVVHGLRACKEHKTVLIAAAMLWKAKFNVMLFDLRNHGSSQVSKYAFSSYGDQEYNDVLGARDYLLETYPRLKGNNNTIGLFGSSMGGAVATVAFAEDAGEHFTAMFLDAPPVNVYDTVLYNLFRFDMHPPFLMSAMCSVQRFIWPYGCPPFAHDPYSKPFGNGTHIYIVSKEDDKVTPLGFNGMEAATIWKEQGANVTTRWGIDAHAPTACSHHADMDMYDPETYQKELAQFFNDHLRRL